jgi:hypothetical protein
MPTTFLYLNFINCLVYRPCFIVGDPTLFNTARPGLWSPVVSMLLEQPQCNPVNNLIRMKSNQIQLSLLGRSNQLGIFSIYTGPSKLPSKTKFR